jgi:polyhydroxyalkanoate synthesis regulator phasin
MACVTNNNKIQTLEAQVKELAELLHKEEIHRISDVQMQQIKIQSLEEQLDLSA